MGEEDPLTWVGADRVNLGAFQLFHALSVGVVAKALSRTHPTAEPTVKFFYRLVSSYNDSMEVSLCVCGVRWSFVGFGMIYGDQ
jgi:hypothetical protein